MRYVELPEAVVTDVRKYVVMRDRRDTRVGDLRDKYESLVESVTQIAEDKMYSEWLDGTVDLDVNPFSLRAFATQLAEETIEVYAMKIKDEAAKKLLKFLFDPNSFEDEEDEEEDNEEE